MKFLLSIFLFILAAAFSSIFASEKPRWELGGGLTRLSIPHYPGSDQHHLFILPIPYVIYRGDFVQLGREQRRAVLYKGINSDLDISLGGSLPVDSNQNEARKGMEDLPPTLHIGPRWNYRAIDREDIELTLRLSVHKAYTLELKHFREVGNLAEFNIDLSWYLDSKQSWRMGIVTGPDFVDRNYLNFLYRVRDEDAKVDRPVWEARSGYGGWDLTLILSKPIDKIWIRGFFHLDYLKGAVFEDSPLVRQKASWNTGIAVTYTFAISKKKVKIPPKKS